ncbi:MAG: hypothetical protein HFH63_07485 [Lachnospiraceae bacterium]|nr:hypothetical protein [Lachnospiraceae bacterium]
MKPGIWSNDSIDDVNFMIFSGHGYKKGKACSYNTLHYYNLNSFTDFHPSSNEGMLDANLTTKEAEWESQEQLQGGLLHIPVIF